MRLWHRAQAKVCLLDPNKLVASVEEKEPRHLKPWEQRKDVVPDSLFVGCEVFEERLRAYLKRSDSRRRLSKDDMISVDGWGVGFLVNLTTPPALACMCNIAIHRKALKFQFSLHKVVHVIQENCIDRFDTSMIEGIAVDAGAGDRAFDGLANHSACSPHSFVSLSFLSQMRRVDKIIHAFHHVPICPTIYNY